MQPLLTPARQSRFEPILRTFNAFLAAESSGAILLLFTTAAALVWANSPWSDSYHSFWQTKIAITIGSFSGAMSLEHCVNDGLMVIFFLLVGLEIKRELFFGELATLQRASLPIAAAIGGMVVPAMIYAAVNAGGPGAVGWGIPMATDIAFAVGILTLVGRSIPTSIKVFLLAVAIVDDLCAVLVIAIFYTSEIFITPLMLAGAFVAALILLNVLRIHAPLPYLLLGVGLWAATLFSGVHATIAGVLLAFTIPATRRLEEVPYVADVRQMLKPFEADAAATPDKLTEDQSEVLGAIIQASKAVQAPLVQVEHALLKPVAFVVIPLFALANAGVDLQSVGPGALRSSITWGVVLGLLLGKPLGILLASWIAIKSKMAEFPAGGTWRHLIGVSILCGIGFTMSLFVANLAVGGHEDQLSSAKVGILAASLISGIAGGAIIVSATRSLKINRTRD